MYIYIYQNICVSECKTISLTSSKLQKSIVTDV